MRTHSLFDHTCYEASLISASEVEYVERFSCDLAHEVLTGELDLALVIEPPDSGMLTDLKIDESPFYVVMSQDDELANHPSLTLNQLAGKRWVLFQRQNHPLL